VFGRLYFAYTNRLQGGKNMQTSLKDSPLESQAVLKTLTFRIDLNKGGQVGAVVNGG
jgi:hypothetical protein